MAGFQVRRTRRAQELEVRGADLAKRAGAALFAADERIRLTVDELGFAEAELGPDATTQLSVALVAVRTHLGDAFRMHRLNASTSGTGFGTRAEVRTRNLRIVQLCEWIDDVLDEHTSALAERIARSRRAPEIIAGVRADLERLGARIPLARETVDRLAARYMREALAQVDANPAEAEQLLAFAEHSMGVAERRREAGQRDQADVALEASVESVRRAATLLDAVETFEVEALRAESVLAAVADESRRSLVAARDEPHSRDVANAAAGLHEALAGLPMAGVNTDPIGHLGRLNEAQAVLDVAIAAARERATRPVPIARDVHHAVEAADRRLDAARDAIARHRGRIGAEALMRLAEAERARTELGHHLVGDSAAVVRDGGHREHAMAMAQRVTLRAGEALELAQRDVEASRASRSMGVLIAD